MKKTKIVCTIGPASESVEMLTKLMEAGMNVARLNFSHGDFEEHGARIKNIREASKKLGKNVGIFLIRKARKSARTIWKTASLSFRREMKLSFYETGAGNT